jgi:hypothetical protein
MNTKLFHGSFLQTAASWKVYIKPVNESYTALNQALGKLNFQAFTGQAFIKPIR